MKKNDRSWLLFIFLTLGLVLIIGCKSEPSGSDFEINIRIKEDPSRLNPLFHLGVTARLVHQYIFVPLADYHPDHYELTPILIDRIPEKQIDETANGQSFYDIRFKEDAVWEDGSHISGEDYLFTVKLIVHPDMGTGAYRGYFDFVDDIIVDSADPKSFRVYFSTDYMLGLESIITIPILPKYVYDPDGRLENLSITDLRDQKKVEEWTNTDAGNAEYVSALNGLKYGKDIIVNCGPYKLTAWETDQNLVIEAKENYWGKNYPENPFLQQGPGVMNFYIIPDETTCISQLKEGNIDVASSISTQRFVELKNNPVFEKEFSFHSPALMRFYFLGINNRHPILSDPKVRRALAMLLDVDQIINNMEDGLGQRLSVPFHPARSYYHKELPLIPFDPEGASRLLREAGWVDSDQNGILDKVIQGKKTELIIEGYTSQQELGRNIMLMLQENGRKAGIKVDIATKDFSVIMRDHVRTRDYGITPLVINQDLNDDDPYQRWHSDNDDPSKGNTVSYRNPEADRLIMEIRSVPGRDQRHDLYKRLQEVMFEDTPSIFLYAPVETIIISKHWKGRGTVKRPGYLANTFTPKT